jgi:ribosomal protein S18 acetylase RimI-like enzyme
MTTAGGSDHAGVGGRVRAAIRADIPELAGVLSRAFAREPQFTWMQPDDELRARVQLAMFQRTLRVIYPVESGTEVLLENGAIIGGAIWAPPGKWKVTPWRQLRVIPGLIRALGATHFWRYARRRQAIGDALDQAHPPEPHWYLAALGADPGAQGKGVGSALVCSGLARCDRDRENTYVECFEPLVPYYERFGFEVMGAIEMPKEVPNGVSMWRARR